MYRLSQQTCGIFEIFNNSLKLYSACFTRLIGYGLAVSALSAVMGMLTETLVPLEPASSDGEQVAMIQAMPALMAIILIFSLLSCIVYAAMIFRIDNYEQGREDSYVEGLWLGLRKFPAIVLAGLLYTIAIVAGTLLLVIPGVILVISLSFCGYFIILENAGGYASLIASHRLVWGDWWRTNAVFMLPGVMLIIFFIIVGFIGAFLDQLIPNSYGILNILIDLMTAIIMPYFYVLGYVQYRDLKLRKKMLSFG